MSEDSLEDLLGKRIRLTWVGGVSVVGTLAEISEQRVTIQEEGGMPLRLLLKDRVTVHREVGLSPGFYYEPPEHDP
ncbi:MAG TPA: hypothetical protein VJN91_06100 [Gammaproteobacteria bacterium]|nr:hypothetical protein [Gammaproteobacteria bacterium]